MPAKSSNKPAPATAKKSAAAEGSSQVLVDRFTRQCDELKSEFDQAQMDAVRRQSDANARFTEASQQAQKAAFKPAQEAYFEYLKIFHRWRMNPAETDVVDVYRAQSNYLEVYQDCQEKARKAVDAAHKKYSEEWETIQKDISSAQQSAFENYVRLLKEGWVEVDPQSFDAQALGTAARSILWASTSALSGGQAT